MEQDTDTLDVLQDAIQRAQHQEAESLRIVSELAETRTLADEFNEAFARYKEARAEKCRLLKAFLEGQDSAVQLH